MKKKSGRRKRVVEYTLGCVGREGRSRSYAYTLNIELSEKFVEFTFMRCIYLLISKQSLEILLLHSTQHCISVMKFIRRIYNAVTSCSSTDTRATKI